MSEFTKKELLLLKNTAIQRERFKTLDERSIAIKARNVAMSKLNNLKTRLAKQLPKTNLAIQLNFSKGALSVINKGRLDPVACAIVARLFKRALSDVFNMSMPSLRGITLSPAEMKLWLAIWRKKMLHITMLLDNFSKQRLAAIDALKPRSIPQLQKKEEKIHLDLGEISMSKMGSFSSQKTQESYKNNYKNQYSEEEIANSYLQIKRYKFSFARKIIDAKNLSDELRSI